MGHVIFCHDSFFIFIFADELSRDYVENVTDDLVKKARLLPWKPERMTFIDSTQVEPPESFFEVNFCHFNSKQLNLIIVKQNMKIIL